eukprot:5643570-Amphidinium_carterae.1
MVFMCWNLTRHPPCRRCTPVTCIECAVAAVKNDRMMILTILSLRPFVQHCVLVAMCHAFMQTRLSKSDWGVRFTRSRGCSLDMSRSIARWLQLSKLSMLKFTPALTAHGHRPLSLHGDALLLTG